MSWIDGRSDELKKRWKKYLHVYVERTCDIVALEIGYLYYTYVYAQRKCNINKEIYIYIYNMRNVNVI